MCITHLPTGNILSRQIKPDEVTFQINIDKQQKALKMKARYIIYHPDMEVINHRCEVENINFRKIVELDASSLEDVVQLTQFDVPGSIRTIDKIRSTCVGDVIYKKGDTCAFMVMGAGFESISIPFLQDDSSFVRFKKDIKKEPSSMEKYTEQKLTERIHDRANRRAKQEIVKLLRVLQDSPARKFLPRVTVNGQDIGLESIFHSNNYGLTSMLGDLTKYFIKLELDMILQHMDNVIKGDYDE